ncbi:MAG: transketolase family protein [Synergistaceae bacterium]|jgi:transketolase|nr:transketolase family protein [Synergistaceae bacterium]
MGPIALNDVKMSDPRKVFGAAVLASALKNPDITVLSADSGGSSGHGEFKKLYPERYYEFGIMEQCVIGVASGLATTGKIPVFCAIAPFVTARPFEMFRNDIGYMRQNVKIVGRNSGVSYSDLGSTHHSLEDFAITRMIPGVTVLAPQDPDEITSAVDAMFLHDGPVYMRIGNDPIPDLMIPGPFAIGRGQTLRPGTDVSIVSTGNLTGAAIAAAEILEGRGISARVVGMPTVHPLDRELIADCAQKTGLIVTIEEHYVIGGLGTIVQESVCDGGFSAKVCKLGLPHVYVSSGPYKELMAFYGLDAHGIARSVADKIGRI